MSRELHRIINRSRAEALKVVKKEVRAVLPKGWVLHLAVGWGLTLFNDVGTCLIGNYETVPPARLPRGLRKALQTAADFVDVYGYGNEKIRGVRR